MDVGFNKPFKDNFRHQFDNHVTNDTRKVKRENVASWIVGSWEGLSAERIARNTWRRVGAPQPVDALPVNQFVDEDGDIVLPIQAVNHLDEGALHTHHELSTTFHLLQRSNQVSPGLTFQIKKLVDGIVKRWMVCCKWDFAKWMSRHDKT